MIDKATEILVIILLVFTPIAFGSQVLWAFSLMELGILLIIILGAVKVISYQLSANISKVSNQSSVTGKSPNTTLRITNPQSLITNSYVLIPGALLCLFLGIVLLQIIPLPAGIIKIISPKTYEIRTQLSVPRSGLQIRNPQSQIRNPQSGVPNPHASNLKPQSVGVNPQTEIRNTQLQSIPLSLFPLATKIELLKWLTLVGLFIFLVLWRLPGNGYRTAQHLIIAIFLVGVCESLYGIFEFFSGHRHILNLDWSARILSVTGTFFNRNYFAGYLIMVIPLGFGLLFSRRTNRPTAVNDWRFRLSSLDGKTLLIGFGLILMILGLLLSASRMGIMSLLLSFSLLIFLLNVPRAEKGVARASVLIFGIAVLWAGWIGLDAVISRFFTASQGLEERWVMWTATLGIFKHYPLFGSGLGTFTEVFPMYRLFHARGLFTHAENDFLQLASEAGLLGVGSLMALFSFLVYRAVTGLRALPRGDPQRYIAIGALVGTLALMFHSTMERNIQVPANAFLYTVMWAIVLRITTGPHIRGGGNQTRNGRANGIAGSF